MICRIHSSHPSISPSAGAEHKKSFPFHSLPYFPFLSNFAVDQTFPTLVPTQCRPHPLSPLSSLACRLGRSRPSTLTSSSPGERKVRLSPDLPYTQMLMTISSPVNSMRSLCLPPQQDHGARQLPLGDVFCSRSRASQPLQQHVGRDARDHCAFRRSEHDDQGLPYHRQPSLQPNVGTTWSKQHEHSCHPLGRY